MTQYEQSPWIGEFPKSRVPALSKQRGATKTDVVVVGGGLTGCMTAYAFAAAGVNVTLVEAGRIGRGSTSAASGWISDDPGLSFAELEQTVGARDARRAWQTWRRAALDSAALLRRLEVKCQLQAQSTLTLAVTPEQIARLKHDQKLRRQAGLDAPLLTPAAIKAETGIAAGAALRGKDSGTLNPYRACLGLADAAIERGATLYEQSPVKRITFTRKWVDIFTAGGSIRADRLVIATGVPTALFKSLVRHFWLKTTYLAMTEPVPSKVRQLLGSRASMVRDLATPPHLIRWIGDDRLLVVGADDETPPQRLRKKTVVQRTGQLMYELSTMYPDISGIQPAFGWSADYARTWNGLPCLGPHRNFPRHLFALGDASRSVTGAYLASRVLLRYHLDDADPADDVFAFKR
jgi:glycine/D-amino acid oxidase-like deaminating enzyme